MAFYEIELTSGGFGLVTFGNVARVVALSALAGGAFGAGVPASVVVSPAAEMATIGTAFPTILTATVTDSSHNPLSGVPIVFSAPGSGASATFSNGTATITVTSSASGTAAAAVTANSVPGTYSVSAATLTASGIVQGTTQLTNAGPASLIALNGTSPQSAPIGTSFNVIGLFALDGAGIPVPNIEIDFAAPASGASAIFTASNTNTTKALTNSSGQVVVGLRANLIQGAYTVTATTPVGPGLQATFALTNSGITVTLPDGGVQSTTVGTAFSNPLRATVVDTNKNPVSGVPITFSAPGGSGPSGTFSNGTATITVMSNALGAVAANFTANSVPGPYTVSANTLTAAGIVGANFSLTNVGPPAFIVTAVNPAAEPVLMPFGLQVTVEDINKNTILMQVPVTFTAPTSGPSGLFGGSSTVTVQTINGFASPVLIANSIPGSYNVIASTPTATGVVQGTFSLTNIGPPTSITPGPGSTPQTTRVGTQFPVPLSVTLKDAAGDAPEATNIVFTAPSSGPSGTFSGGTTTLNVAAGGSASVPFTANNISGGPYTVTATSNGVTATFSLTNQGAPSSINTVTGSTPQSAPINGAFPNPLAVIVKDQNSAGVVGAVVTFTAPSSGPSGVFGNSSVSMQVTTDATGTAAAPFKANSLVGGPYAVQATTPAATGGLLSATFALTNTGGAPVVTANPTDVTVAPGATASFTAAATGSPAPTVQWQQSTNGGSTFSDIPGATATALSFPAASGQNGNKYHAVFTNSIASATTTAATLTVQSGPTIRSVTPVIPSFLGAAGFSSNMYLEIYGANFTADTRQWAGSDFNGLLAPTSLEGVSVQVNGKPAYVYFISPGQININVPDDSATGPVTLQVFTPTPSNMVTVQRSSISPTLQTTAQFNVGGKQYVVALTPDFKSFIGQPGLIAGASFVVAHPGDTILIYALGAGPTNPATQAGVIASVNSDLALPFQLKIGGVQATTTFAGLLANTIGLYQLNVVVPQIPAGDQPIEFIVNGVSNSQNLLITIGP